MQKPFDVSTLMEGIDAEDLKDTHDHFGTGPGHSVFQRRPLDPLHLQGAEPRPPNDQPAIEEILIERGKTHGDFADHAMITQFIKRIMRTGKNWEALSDMQKESLEMNAHKIGRILSGNPNHQDHWDDIAGYAKLIAQRIGS